MGLTVTILDKERLGRRRVTFADVTFDSSYAAGGEALTPAQLLMTTEVTTVVAENEDGYSFRYDTANSKLVVTDQPVVTKDFGSPAVGATTAVHAAVTDNGSEQTITTAITSPAVPRNITATSGGTAADIAAIQVTINGTDAAGAVITEDLPVFTENSATTVVGSKAFATVTSIVIPAHDGTAATTAIGTGAKLGLGVKLARNTVLAAYLAGVKEGTAPTVAFDATNVSGNTVTLNSTLNGTAVLADYYLPTGASDLSGVTARVMAIGV